MRQFPRAHAAVAAPVDRAHLGQLQTLTAGETQSACAPDRIVGHGKPGDRDKAAIENDFVSGKFSCDFSRKHYGAEPNKR